MHRPFFSDPNFYPSPPPSWHLPSYANNAAIELARGSYCYYRSENAPSRSLEFVDIEAGESDESDDESRHLTDITPSTITLSSSDESDCEEERRLERSLSTLEDILEM